MLLLQLNFIEIFVYGWSNFFSTCWFAGGKSTHPANIYLLKVNNRSTRKRCEICSKLTIKLPKRSQWRRFGVFIINSEHISQLFLVFLLLTLKKQMLAGHLTQITRLNKAILTTVLKKTRFHCVFAANSKWKYLLQ